MKQEHISRFLTDVAGTPVANTRNGMRHRQESLWMRALALGFLAGLASSVALWVYDRLNAHPRANPVAEAS